MFGLGLLPSAGIAFLALFLSGALTGIEGYRLGAKVTAEGFEKAQIQVIALASAKARAQQMASDRVSYNIGLTFGGEQLRITGLTVTQIKEVPIYVTAKADAACVLTAGFVELHDAAASGRDPAEPVPSASSGTVDSPSRFRLSQLAGTVVGNYGKYRTVAAELTALQAWVTQQAALDGGLMCQNPQKTFSALSGASKACSLKSFRK